MFSSNLIKEFSLQVELKRNNNNNKNTFINLLPNLLNFKNGGGVDRGVEKTRDLGWMVKELNNETFTQFEMYGSLGVAFFDKRKSGYPFGFGSIMFAMPIYQITKISFWEFRMLFFFVDCLENIWDCKAWKNRLSNSRRINKSLKMVILKIGADTMSHGSDY